MIPGALLVNTNKARLGPSYLKAGPLHSARGGRLYAQGLRSVAGIALQQFEFGGKDHSYLFAEPGQVFDTINGH